MLFQSIQFDNVLKVSRASTSKYFVVTLAWGVHQFFIDEVIKDIFEVVSEIEKKEQLFILSYRVLNAWTNFSTTT